MLLDRSVEFLLYNHIEVLHIQKSKNKVGRDGEKGCQLTQVIFDCFDYKYSLTVYIWRQTKEILIEL